MLERGKLTMDPNGTLAVGQPYGDAIPSPIPDPPIAGRPPGVIKSRDQLMDAAYPDHVYVDDRTIDSHIKRLRNKFRAVDPSFGRDRDVVRRGLPLQRVTGGSKLMTAEADRSWHRPDAATLKARARRALTAIRDRGLRGFRRSAADVCPSGMGSIPA